ncbi:MAG: TonB-dependent receptor, partial [Candidatus Cloacimonetes bacterium]|nr:TonB-dependent receptor [Candidatus Cloacimonadota bacterium]
FILISTALFGLDISGIVLNEKGKPIDNVIVSTDSKAVITGKHGRFILSDVNPDRIVTFHKIGFKDTSIIVSEIPSRIILETIAIPVDGIKVSGRRSVQLLEKTSQKTVINVDAENNYKNAADILRDRADLLISGTKLHGEQQNVSIPGYKARHTLVMLDGIPLNKSGTAFDISTIPAEIIESIEIIKGSASSQGGAGAMGGIININTKRSSGKLSSSLDHTFGSFGLDKTSFTFSGANPKFQFFAFLSKSYSRNDFQYKPPEYWPNPDSLRNRINNEKEIYDINLNIGNSNSFCEINYKLLFQHFFKKLPGPANYPDLYNNSRLKGETYRHLIALSKRLKEFIIKADMFNSDERTIYDNTRLEEPFNSNLFYYVYGRNYNRNRGVNIKLENQVKDFYFDWGGDYDHETFEYKEITNEDDSIPEVFRENFGVFGNTKLQKSFFLSKTSLTASIRWDRTTGFKDFTSWRIAPEFSYENYFIITLGGNVSNGFTLPSFYDIYWKGDAQAVGNPDLLPETSLSWQLFTNLILYEHRVKFTYRHNDIDDMIIWFLDYNHTWKPDNISYVEVSNYELEFKLKPFKFIEVNGIYNRTKAFNRTQNYNGKKIIYTPDYTFNLNLQMNYKLLSGKISYSKTGEQWSTPDQLTIEKQLSAYELVNVQVWHSVNWKKFELSAAVSANNVFDELYEIYKYMPQPGFNWEMNVGLKYEM